MADHLAAAQREMKAAPGPAARLLRMAEHHLRALGENRDLAVVFQVELRQSTKFMERFTASWLQDYFQLLYGVIEEGQRAGVFRAEVPKKVVAKALFGALDEMVTSFILSGKDYDLAGLAAPVVDLFLRGVAVPGKLAHARPVLAATGASRGGR
jgi:TetR/AcrR family fatty acid metabolism transcriptional regulator